MSSLKPRRTRAGVQQLVAEFVSSSMPRRECCQSRGLSFSTLDRHPKKLRWKRRRRRISSVGRLVPGELAARKSPAPQESSCGLAVVLPGGRRFEVRHDFDTGTFERIVSGLEPGVGRVWTGSSHTDPLGCGNHGHAARGFEGLYGLVRDRPSCLEAHAFISDALKWLCGLHAVYSLGHAGSFLHRGGWSVWRLRSS
jgi:hypothetical protein